MAIPPKYLIDVFTENRDVHNHNTRQTYLYHGVSRTVSTRICICYSLPVLIGKTPNNVLQSVLTARNIDEFAFLENRILYN